MTGVNVYPIQQAIKTYLEEEIPWRVVTGAVPDANTLQLVDGELDPYVVLRYSDIMPASGGGSFMGARYDEYYSYVDALCVANEDEPARELAALVNSKLLGKRFPNSGEIRPNFGGGVFAVPTGERLPYVVVAVTSFRFNLNLENVGAVYPA